MLAALVLSVLTVTPAQAGDLEIKNVRLTYGIHGQERKDDKILPGEKVYISYDVHGLKVAPDGEVKYETSYELIQKSSGKTLLKEDFTEKGAINNLGGSVLPSFALTVFGLDTTPGTYTIKVVVRDKATKKDATLTKDVEVVAPNLGFVRVQLLGAGGGPAAPVAVPGQALLLQYALVGFKVNKDGAGDVTLQVELLDDTGKPTVETPAMSRFKPTPKPNLVIVEFKLLPLQLNRPGKFKLVLKATDHLGMTTTTTPLDIEVLNR
ncbi:MAG: hypothetical protein EBV06_09185 [Planctomycetia bacterium]|nr:hypothetical protein [Planctomycetia bacterium]